MARVVIEIEDLPGGKVKVVLTPTFETILKLMVSGNELTSGQAYALLAANTIRDAAKGKSPIKVAVPRKRQW